MVTGCISNVNAFTIVPKPLPIYSSFRQKSSNSNTRNHHRSTSQLSASSGEFETQELRAQLNAMCKSDISPRNLSIEKQQELQQYVSSLLRSRDGNKNIPLREMGEDGAKSLHGTWRLSFSTSPASLDDLPLGSNLYITFQPNFKAKYSLIFSKQVWGLKNILAKCSYMVDCSPTQPGLVTMVYQDIVTDVMGMKNVNVGFGMFQGRTVDIESVWFDGNMWIERKYDMNGDMFYNLYFRMDD